MMCNYLFYEHKLLIMTFFQRYSMERWKTINLQLQIMTKIPLSGDQVNISNDSSYWYYIPLKSCNEIASTFSGLPSQTQTLVCSWRKFRQIPFDGNTTKFLSSIPQNSQSYKKKQRTCEKLSHLKEISLLNVMRYFRWDLGAE
jgi:hypothetical protein